MIRGDHPILGVGGRVLSHQPFKLLKGLTGAYLAYPLAERREQRNVLGKLSELRAHYKLPFAQRLKVSVARLADTLEFAGVHVPYYKDLFASVGFKPASVLKDIRYIEDLPFLDKDIIREQGHRLLSLPLEAVRHHVCKTGGSTGLSSIIYYNQEGADYAAAVTLYARERIGKKRYKSELHFACRFPDMTVPEWPSREDFKCFAMNRSNIFFDRIDDLGLEEIWKKLCLRKPYLVHGHPSTLYSLACYIEDKYGPSHTFEVFESSGEWLAPYMREKIAHALGCRVVDRYGLAELGVMAYALQPNDPELEVLESEGWAESRHEDDGTSELVFTGYRNRLMPLIRYRTGDLAEVQQNSDRIVLANILGRIHDVVPINGVVHPTHHIQDMLDHRVGGIQEFQIDLRSMLPVLRIVLESGADATQVSSRIEQFWPAAFKVEFVDHDAFVRVGRHAKFRHVVTK